MIFAVVFAPTVKPEPVPTPDRPALSEAEVERKSKSIIDEFLHINDYKVLRLTGQSTPDEADEISDGCRLELGIQMIRPHRILD